MGKFLVVLEGRNCLVPNAGKDMAERYGFFASRYVEADGVVAAQEMALQGIRKELLRIVKNRLSDPPMILVDETRCVAEFDSSVATKGFTFYLDENPIQ